MGFEKRFPALNADIHSEVDSEISDRSRVDILRQIQLSRNAKYLGTLQIAFSKPRVNFFLNNATARLRGQSNFYWNNLHAEKVGSKNL